MTRHFASAIADEVVSRLSKIATAQKFSGLDWATETKPTVLRLTRNARTLVNYPTIIVSFRQLRKNRNAQRSTHGLFEHNIDFQIEYYLEFDEDIDEEILKALADIHIALGADHTLGGTCRDSRIERADVLLSDNMDPFAGLVVEFTASARTTDANPETLI
jgi:hypothetical protein